jgi:hypothetical protein
LWLALPQGLPSARRASLTSNATSLSQKPSLMSDPWVISDLQQIANGPDAEGIEDELAKTIEYLRNLPTEAR